ncbi:MULTISPECIES: conjugal transfer protein TraO [Dysgonomonas]|uniref:conjugal transfer protein TraO n=1 Tax=Dysgonomonas TaxID=156973 RepID=UPI00092912B1|nr:MULTISPECIES: conjugal transfer protein TraO [Dysgonomonas]MBN9300556.1 conjugal transfer protein TraO [Dysgonomonas mossii]OJX56136.1 MAG: conjugal transfer protein [Dysgonomonas sp. 37-18]
MRTLLIITLSFALSLFLIEQAYAQRYLPGQKGIQITGGAVDGFQFKKTDGQAFFVGMGLSTYTHNGNRWTFGAEYLQKSYEYKDRLLPLSQITVEGGHYLKFLSDPSKTVSFSVGVSAMAGYETINWGKELLFDGATITSEDNFLYGGAVSFEIETYLTDRVVLLLNARERLLGGSLVNKFHTQIGLGIKIIIN